MEDEPYDPTFTVPECEISYESVVAYDQLHPVRRFAAGGIATRSESPCPCGHLPRQHDREPGVGCTVRPCFCLHPTGRPLRPAVARLL